MGDWRSGVPSQRAASLAPSTFSNNSQSKLLPKTPQELSSSDLIASLNAQQDDLSQQRRNIQRVIADLEKPEAKNPVTNSFKVIREREKQLENLKLDLADVVRKDHELGMRLHRAWKRKERDDPNTPGSTFWVRRATAG
jgi:Zn-dependent M32 family carboxypeptidase